jgi:hypothetical protein
MREFLLETSVLDRLSGPLCDAVTGRVGSQGLLERAERAGLFLVPLDEVRGWWRYHHLFADLLRGRLQAERPGQLRALHQAAATWHEKHGLADEAGFPSNRGGFLIADSCNFAASSDYRTPVHFVSWRSFACRAWTAGRAAPWGGAGWGRPRTLARRVPRPQRGSPKVSGGEAASFGPRL